MIIDTKLTVLYALYIEWQKDLPELFNVTAGRLKLQEDVFYMALFKLQSEGYIQDVKFGDAEQSPYPISASLYRASLTVKGIEKVEANLELEKDKANVDKLRHIAKTATKFGWVVLEQATAAVIAHILGA